MDSPPRASPSPSSSQASFNEPNLEQLVEYLLASKRSLSAIGLVWRARELVEGGREALEENAVLCAKNAYIRHSLDQQAASLEAIRHGATIVDAEGFDDFQATVQSLDTASSRLQKMLVSLHNTPVEAALRPADEEPKCLFDFVDEGGISDIERVIKASIDRFDTARSTLAETCEAFEADLERLHSSIVGEEQNSDDDAGDDLNSPIPSLFYQLETRATEAASHLEGLVKHYDLCVTALRHTEGGGEAITQASTGEERETSALIGLGVDLGKLEEAPTKPMSEEERRELLNVLFKDADEVEEVVADIKDSLVEMEDGMTQVATYLKSLREVSAHLSEGMVFLREVTGRLPMYISACAEFQRAWDEEKELLHEKLEELEGLTEFYAGFESAYDELILEIQRRRQVKRDMDKVIKAAMSELEELYQNDLQRRDSFRENQAEYIPSDLWPGLVNVPLRFRITRDDEDVDEDVIPEIKKSVLEKAMARVTERAKPFKRPS